MMQTAAYGRLGQDPRSIETRTGKPMVVVSLAVAVDQDQDAPPLWLGIVAFGRQADDLMRHTKGDLVSVSGRVQRKRYTGRDGTEREQLQVVADAVVSAKTTRSAGGQRREQPSDRPEHRDDRSSERGLDDDIPF